MLAYKRGIPLSRSLITFNEKTVDIWVVHVTSSSQLPPMGMYVAYIETAFFLAPDLHSFKLTSSCPSSVEPGQLSVANDCSLDIF